jgi:hypothetical protein
MIWVAIMVDYKHLSQYDMNRLQNIIEESDHTAYRIQRATVVNSTVIMRFMKTEGALVTYTVFLSLAAYVGLTVALEETKPASE